ncbi:UBP-type zinc finger domain-containing protein [Krasilnikovia sp. M28-CT-15]|uniref:UBP-type zinc finger domain-containing protein n=1 Tax=Krasilnikovia sp. M28-CT-15 TaxID=3373540 RepID=UPI00399CDDE0
MRNTGNTPWRTKPAGSAQRPAASAVRRAGTCWARSDKPRRPRVITTTAPGCQYPNSGVDKSSEADHDRYLQPRAALTGRVHLRLCLTCGHVSCCDASPMRHARAHAHTVGHPIVQSFQPGDDWCWSYVDETLV